MQEPSLVGVREGQAVTTSLQLAEVFGKRHADVIRAIEAKIQPTQNCVRYSDMFAEGTYIDAKGETRKMYYLTKDGFTFIAMGFTGELADSAKLAYIDQFNRMAKTLRDGYLIPNNDPNLTRLPNGDVQLTGYFEGHPVRSLLTYADKRKFVVSKDTNIALGYLNHRQATQYNVQPEHKEHRQIAQAQRMNALGGGYQTALVLDEEGLAELLEHCFKPARAEFGEFIAAELFPKLVAAANRITANSPAPHHEPEQTSFDLTHEDTGALLNLAEVAKRQGNDAVYNDLIQRALAVPKF